MSLSFTNYMNIETSKRLNIFALMWGLQLNRCYWSFLYIFQFYLSNFTRVYIMCKKRSKQKIRHDLAIWLRLVVILPGREMAAAIRTAYVTQSIRPTDTHSPSASNSFQLNHSIYASTHTICNIRYSHSRSSVFILNNEHTFHCHRL